MPSNEAVLKTALSAAEAAGNKGEAIKAAAAVVGHNPAAAGALPATDFLKAFLAAKQPYPPMTFPAACKAALDALKAAAPPPPPPELTSKAILIALTEAVEPFVGGTTARAVKEAVFASCGGADRDTSIAALLALPVRAYEEDGNELPDDAPHWTVFHHIHSHEALFDRRDSAGRTLDERVAANDGPVHFSRPSPLAVDHERFVALIAKWTGKGVLEELTPEQVADPRECAAVSQLTEVVKGPMRTSAAADAAIATGDLAALASAAEADAADSFATFLCALEANPGEHARDVLERVLAANRDPNDAKRRMCANGHALGEYLHEFGFEYTGFGDFLDGLDAESHMGKNDAENFFYVLELAPASRRYFCVEYAGKIYRYRRISMGAGDSPGVASLLSAVICDIVARRAGHELDAYLDDFIVGGPPSVARYTQDVLIATLPEVGVAESVAKRVPTGPQCEALGRLVDLPRRTMSLPLPKLYQYMLHAITVALTLGHADARVRAAVTKASISTLNGRLLWAAAATLRGRCHLSALISAAVGRNSVEQHREAVCANLAWWRKQWRTGAMRHDVLFAPAPTDIGVVRVSGGGHEHDRRAAVRSDAGEPAGGAVYDGQAIHRAWTPEEAAEHSDFQEALMVLTAMRQWGPAWRGQHMLFLTDNYGNVFTIMKGRAGADRPAVQRLVNEMYDLAEAGGFFFSVAWIPREGNLAADTLSKCATRAAAEAACSDLGVALLGEAPTVK